jgi:hypothetical protein
MSIKVIYILKNLLKSLNSFIPMNPKNTFSSDLANTGFSRELTPVGKIRNSSSPLISKEEILT